MVKLNGESLDIVDDNISKLKEIFPEVVNGDNQVDFDNLRDLLEKDIEVIDDSEEHYKFTWWGKKKAKQEALKTTTKTLRPVIKDSKNWKETKNIYIEGDNLDALKILLKAYRNKIKMIYIDPPYNTGKDFVYHDNLIETEKEHLKNTNQMNEKGQLLENPKTEGKYHSNWLNMMYPRLYIAKKLLTNDGIIFISIDDHEVENLKKICNEIFGENNFIGQWNWFKSQTPPNLSKKIKKNIEYILCYEKQKNNNKYKGLKKISKSDDPLTKPQNSLKKLSFAPGTLNINISNTTIKKGIYGTEKYPNKLLNDLIVEDNTNKNLVEFENRFIWLQEKLNEELKKGTKVNLSKNLVLSYKKSDYENEVPTNFIDANTGSTTENAGKKLTELFDNIEVFDYPKPIELIKYLFNFYKSDEKEIILDFFSGSASTAEALFKSNCEENREDTFILVQYPEEITEKDKTGKSKKIAQSSIKFLTEHNKELAITEIGKERIRRAGDKIIEESENKNLDIGFKVFKIDDSNFIPWNPKLKTSTDVEQAILGTANDLVQGRSELDLIYELLLLQLDLDLNAKIDEKEVNNHKFYIVNNGFLLICLDPNIDETIVNDIINLRNDLMTEYCKVILLDKALNSISSINIYNTLDSEDIKLDTI